MNISDIRELVTKTSRGLRELNDYGAYDCNRGISKLERGLLFELAKIWTKQQGIRNWFFGVPNLGHENGFIAFHCLECEQYHVLTNIDKDRFSCPSCGQVHVVNRDWNIVYT